MFNERPVVSSLWVGGSLSYLELVSLRSMQRWGHKVKLYHYKPLENVPNWLETYDANEIMPVSDERLEEFKNTYSIIANMFRIHLMAKTDEVWSDCDVYFLRPLPKQDYLFTVERSKPFTGWNNSLLRLPSDSAIVADLLDFISTDYPLIPVDPKFSNIAKNLPIIEQNGGNGNVHIRNLAWGTSGPSILSYLIHKHKLQRFGWPVWMHAPIGGNQKQRLVKKRMGMNLSFNRRTQSVHFYGSSLRRLLISRFDKNQPMRDSLVWDYLVDQGINPDDYPLLTAVDKVSHKEARGIDI